MNTTLEHLRAKTHSSHQALEKLLIPKIKQISGKEEYAKLLATFYGYFFPLEQQINAYLHPEKVPYLEDRRKTEMLMGDFIQVSGTVANVPICDDLPEIDTEAKALGALYVLEGSTLGGKVITKMIMNNLQIDPEEGIQFFSGYGDDTERMWHSFTEMLNNYTNDEQVQQVMTKAADDTFIKFKDWIAHN